MKAPCFLTWSYDKLTVNSLATVRNFDIGHDIEAVPPASHHCNLFLQDKIEIITNIFFTE